MTPDLEKWRAEYEPLSEDAKYRHWEGRIALAIRMQAEATDDWAACLTPDLYQNCKKIDPRFDRFIDALSHRFNINLRQRFLEPPLSAADKQFWDVVARSKARGIEPPGAWIAKAIVYTGALIYLAVMAGMIAAQGWEGLLNVLIINAFVLAGYGVGLLYERPLWRSYRSFSEKTGLTFTSEKKFIPLYLFHPKVSGIYRYYKTTLGLHQTRPPGASNPRVVFNESWLAVEVAEVSPVTPFKIERHNYEKQLADPAIHAFLTAPLRVKIREAFDKKALRGPLAINKGALAYHETGSLRGQPMVDRFYTALQLMVEIANTCRATTCQ